MKKISIIIAFVLVAVGARLYAAPAATIQYCDNNRAIAVTNALAQVNIALPSMLNQYVGPSVDEYMASNGIPRIVTNTVVDLEIVSNITANVEYRYYTNYVDNVISNYWTTNYYTQVYTNVIDNEHYTTNYTTVVVDNVISNYWTTNYYTQVYTNIIHSDYYHTNYNTIVTHETHYTTQVITGDVYYVTTTNQLNVSVTITNGANYYVASLVTNTAISGDLNVYSTTINGSNVTISQNPIDSLVTIKGLNETLKDYPSQSYYVYGTNQMLAISGDLGVYSTAYDTKYHADQKYWEKIVDKTSGNVYVFVDYSGSLSSPSYRFVRYRKLGGPTQTGTMSFGNRNWPYYYGGITLMPYSSYVAYDFTAVVFNDDGTRAANSSSLLAQTLNDGGYWTVGSYILYTPYTYTPTNRIGTLTTVDDVNAEIGNSVASPNRTFLVSTNGATALFGDLSIKACNTTSNTNGAGYAKYYTASDGSLYIFAGTFTTTSGYYRYGAMYRNSEYMDSPKYSASNGFSWYGHGILVVYYWSGSSTSSGTWRMCKHGGTADYFGYIDIALKHQDVYNLQYRLGGTSSGQLVSIDLFESKHTRAYSVIDHIPTWNSITNWIETNFQRKP